MVIKMHPAVAFLLFFVASALGQTITVTPSSTLAGQSVVVKVKDMNCAEVEEAAALVDGQSYAATVGDDENSWIVALPDSLNPKKYNLRMKCGDKTSRAVAMEILKPPEAEVVCATNMTPKDGTPEGAKCEPYVAWSARMGDRISVKVRNFKNPGKPIHLVVAGIELKNVTLNRSTDKGTDVFDGWLEFDNSDSSNRKAWVHMLRTARNRDILEVSVGPEGGPAFPSTAKIKLNLYPGLYAWFAILLITGLIVALLILGKKSNLLRHEVMKADVKPPLSLAKYQMAVWLLVVVSAYLFVSLITGTSASTSPTALVLIGISGATGLSAIVIENSKRDEAKREQNSLEAEKKDLTQRLDDPATGLKAQVSKLNPNAPDAIQALARIDSLTNRLSQVETQLAKAQVKASAHKRWILDLLNDENGVSFHRLQIFVWTIVLVCAFIRAVWRDLAMPEFDATTLGLMGISSGTYIGFKFPEKK